MSRLRHAPTAPLRAARSISLLAVCSLCSCGREDGPPPEPPPVQVAVEIQAEDPLPPCTAPVPSPGLLTDAREAAGVDFTHIESPFPDLGPGWDGDTFAGIFGGGVAAADFDRDGHIDLFLANGGGANALHWGLGDGTFEPDSAQTASVSWPDEDTSFVSAADFDGDADLDLLIGGWETLRLLENNGDRTFTDVAAEVGLRAAPAYPGASAWADMDGDGDLDVFVGAYGEPTTGYNGAAALPSALYENQGGRFVDVTERALPYVAGREGLVLHARWQDLDRDGDPDLMQVNDFGATRGATQLWENRGNGTFVDRGPASGLGTLPYPMGGVAHDLDGDGTLDLAFSDLARTHLFVGQGPDPWSWATADAVWGADLVDQDSDASWSVATLDLDGSGAVGLYFTYGPMEGEPLPNDPGAPFDPEQPDRLLVPEDGANGFRLQDRADAFASPQIGRARGLTTTDLNADGVPDVVVSNLGQQPAILMGACTAAARTWVRLEQPDSGNVHAIGAEVTLTVGDRSWSQTILGGGPGSGSAQEPSLHFGLGDATAVDAAFIRWPDGAFSELDGVCAGCVVTLRRGDPLGG